MLNFSAKRLFVEQESFRRGEGGRRGRGRERVWRNNNRE